MPAGTPVLAPLPARIHSLADNANFGDYGPTVVLEHNLEGVVFYTLYGHLARREWAQLRPGQPLAQGEMFATVGPWPENGDWPPHLHFQLITDMQGRSGDFPGVSAAGGTGLLGGVVPRPEPAYLNHGFLRILRIFRISGTIQSA